MIMKVRIHDGRCDDRYRCFLIFDGYHRSGAREHDPSKIKAFFDYEFIYSLCDAVTIRIKKFLHLGQSQKIFLLGENVSTKDPPDFHCRFLCFESR